MARPKAATLALSTAALIALTAVAIALFQRGEDAPAAPQPPAATAPTMEQMVSGLVEQVRRDPDDHRGWYQLGLAYRDMERFADAASAFRRAMQLQPRNADYTAYLGEMLILAADAPPPEAERLFRRTLELQPGNPQARYYLATIRDMRGDHRGALAELTALLREAPAGAPWEAQVREAAAAIARANNLAADLPPRAAPSSTATAAIPGPTPEQMAAASRIPPSQQDEMVRGMVDRLAARLRQNPRDADGWIRLMRSRMVLRDPAAATEALRAALAAYPDEPATRTRLRQAARELAVPAG